MSGRLCAGLIGCGNLGKVHTEALKQIDGMDMIAFCDVDVARARSFCEQYGGGLASDDPDDLFNAPALDAIYVCTGHASPP